MTQTWNPETYARDARFVSDLGAPVLDLLAPQPAERILDLGCGDGVLTAKLQSLGCDVLGVDASAAQVEATKKLGVSAQTIDGENLRFENEFDAVFSNAALHWMRNNPDAVIAGVHRALRPGGRFVAEMGGARCVEKIRTALIAALDRRNIDGKSADLWFFPTVEDYSARLARGGFTIDYIALIPRPTPLPGDVIAWLRVFAHNFTDRLPPQDRDSYLEEVQAALKPQLCDANGKWTADYTRLRFKATKSR
ncbi:MAG TPA: methyltransferase domain-containing protein [Candidatus Acidoferrum sp.]|nr:methyltransferase domain-containing protein [Candidatus Acidoferrum sp.]